MSDRAAVNAAAANAKMLISFVSLVGVALLGLGLILLVYMTTHLASADPGQRRIEGMLSALPGLLCMLTGLGLALLPWLAFSRTMQVYRHAAQMDWRLEQLTAEVETHRALLENIRESTALSDAAKHIAYRQRDYEALRAAIQEDMGKQDYEAALRLVNEMERGFGYKQESERFREQIEAARKAAAEEQAKAAFKAIEDLLAKREWAAVTRELDKAVKAFPSHPEFKKLAERIQPAKDAHKTELLKQWKDAIVRDDVDRGVELLKQLDQYLTPGEAEVYKESARDVFKKRLQQLGVQFALHVHDRNWAEAFKIGKQITDEFPNTRIASEVKESLPKLREKAGMPIGAA